jgi:2-polyprenyl-6-methoxyphenol hydroxylase-like FAD-dependent oxidoreductase
MGNRQNPVRRHAVVIGASIAGLCAARVLSDFYDEVTVYERDELPDRPAHRRTVPQDRHVHILMARGAAEFEDLYPGLLDELVESGVHKLANAPDSIYFGAAGHVLGTGQRLRHEFTAYVPSRKQLEWQIRQRTAALSNVTIERADVVEPVYDGAQKVVTGVLVDGRPTPSNASALTNDGPALVAADLVVDASGRGSRLPTWLTKWGFPRAAEDTLDVGIGYATQQLRIPDGLIAEKVIVAGVSRERSVGIGMLFYEDGTWGMTTFGVAGHEPPKTFEEMCDAADEILPDHAAAIRSAEPLGDIAFHKYPVSRWRRYDKLEEFPSGIIPFGDAVVSFNPTYGQGMTMSAIQAGNLRQALISAPEGLWRELSLATAKTTYPVWTMTAIGDLVLHGGTGAAPWWYQPVGSLFDQFLGAAETDPVLAEWFLRRFSLLDSLYMVPPPSIVGRTIRHNMRLWWAGRRATRPATGYRALERSKSGSR